MVDISKIQEFMKNNPSNSGGGSKDGVIWSGFPGNDDTKPMKVRILPEDGRLDGLIGRIVKYHHDITPSDPSFKYGEKIICMSTHFMPCPICELISDYETRLGERVKQFKPREVAYFNAIIRSGGNEKTPKGVPTILNARRTFFEFIYEKIVEFEGRFLGYENGRDVIIKRESVGGKFEYTLDYDNTPVTTQGAAALEEIKKKVIDLKEKFGKPDDGYFQKNIVGARNRLKLQLENMLLGGGESNPPPRVDPRSEPPKPPSVNAPSSSPSTTTATPPPSDSPNSSAGKAPNGAPPCFGDATVYVEGSDKCNLCFYDYQCSISIKKAGK